MPLVNGKLITPDDAIANGFCPETGISLRGVNIEEHISRTWKAQPAADPSGDEPRRRMQLLRDFKKTHEHWHPQYDEKGQLIEGSY
jgi:hypothetical protein